MALIPVRRDRTSKPPIGTPLRSDGHWSVENLIVCLPVNEQAGFSLSNGGSLRGTSTIAASEKWTASGIINTNNISVSAPYPAILPPELTILQKGAITRTGIAGIHGYSNNTGLYVRLEDTNTIRSVSVHGSGVTSNVTGNIPNKLANMQVLSMLSGVGSGAGFGKKRIWVDNSLVIDTETAGMVYPHAPMSFAFCSDGPGYSSSHIFEYGIIWAKAFADTERMSLSSNPWQIYEPETVWVEVGGGGEAALFAGSIYGLSSASAQLSTAITIASQVVAAGSIAGGIDTAIRLATSTQGAASASALLSTAIRMAASAQGCGSSTADLSTTIALAADILAASSASGALSTAIRFGGALSGSSTITAALTNAITMAAQAAGLGSISGQLSGTVAAALFAGTVSGSSSASANLSTAVVLAAAAQGSATAQAVLSTALELAAQVNGIGAASGALGADISGLSGSLHGSSEAQATLSTAIHLMGVAAGQCGIVGRLAEPVEILAQLRVMASDPLAMTISVRDPLALRVTVH